MLTTGRMAIPLTYVGYILYIWGSVMGWKPKEIKVYLAHHLRREVRDSSIRSRVLRRVVYGGKPEGGSVATRFSHFPSSHGVRDVLSHRPIPVGSLRGSPNCRGGNRAGAHRR
jgi:hypothetical protein